MKCEGILTQRCEEERVEERSSVHCVGAGVGERKSARTQGSERERERESPWLLLYMFFPPLGLPYVNWVSQECCLFYLRSSLWSSDLHLTFFCSIFEGFSLPGLLATAILDSCFLFSLPNIAPLRDGRPNSLGIGVSRSFWLLPAELGWREILGLPLLLVSGLRVLILGSI